jgi:hypothetical protein
MDKSNNRAVILTEYNDAGLCLGPVPSQRLQGSLQQTLASVPQVPPRRDAGHEQQTKFLLQCLHLRARLESRANIHPSIVSRAGGLTD